MLHNFGSINLDHIYRVPHLVTPGETLTSHGYRVGLGGKGANQSLAMARAGGQVRHWGRLGRQDGWARDLLEASGIDVDSVELVDEPSGHAIIQVDDAGENAILLFPGANHGFTEAALDARLAEATPGDWLLAQNECIALPYLFEAARKRGLHIAFNPAPMTAAAAELPLEACRLLFVNRSEAEMLTDLPAGSAASALLDALAQRLPATETVLTLGGDGAWYQFGETRHFQPPMPVTPVDTTAAGDTFIGYYLAALQDGEGPEACLERAAAAAALGVQRSGAAESIPEAADVAQWQRQTQSQPQPQTPNTP